MANTTTFAGKKRVTGRCYPFLLLGRSLGQVSMAMFGIIVCCFVFRNHPLADFNLTGKYPLLPLEVFAVGLFASEMINCAKYLRILNGGNIVSAKICDIEIDSSGEDMKYTLFFEYAGELGERLSFQAVREVNDLQLNETVRVFLNQELGAGLLEPNLPGGLKFDHVYGMEPIPLKCWWRIMFVPLLTVVPLVGLSGPASNFIQQMAAKTGWPVIYYVTIIPQWVWCFFNRRYFSPGKPVELNAADECCLK